MSIANAFQLYTVIFLYHDDNFLLLKRSPNKRIAPNRWTGVGGGVEQNELDDLNAAALRELEEETALRKEDIGNLVLRRVLYHNRPDDPLTGLLYFTATYEGKTPECSEGRLHWKKVDEFVGLDIIETTAETLKELVKDIKSDPQGCEKEKLGTASFSLDGKLQSVVWA